MILRMKNFLFFKNRVKDNVIIVQLYPNEVEKKTNSVPSTYKRPRNDTI